jgi:hypothetical protein
VSRPARPVNTGPPSVAPESPSVTHGNGLTTPHPNSTKVYTQNSASGSRAARTKMTAATARYTTVGPAVIAIITAPKADGDRCHAGNSARIPASSGSPTKAGSAITLRAMASAATAGQACRAKRSQPGP